MLVQAFFQTGTHLSNVPDVPTGQADNGVVDAVMKMWPPPAGPKDRDPELDRGSSHGPPKSPSSYEDNQSQRSMSRLSDQPGPQRVLSPSGHPAAGTPNTLPPSGDTPFCLSLAAFMLFGGTWETLNIIIRGTFQIKAALFITDPITPSNLKASI